MWLSACAGGAGFWLANFAISLTPVAAEYRAGLSISYFPMLAEALVGGLALGFAVSYVLYRHFDRIPTRSPMAKAILLSLLALVVLTVLVDVPGKFFTATENPVRYFVIAAAFNMVRFLALGVAVGGFYGWNSSRGAPPTQPDERQRPLAPPRRRG